jgi:L-threonylcarbamoyladenylate synthase
MDKMNNDKMVSVNKNVKAAIKLAEKIYNDGGVFIYPTDTIYGFGGDPFNNSTVEKIDNVKGRIIDQKYILLINNVENLKKYVQLNNIAHSQFLLNIWPAPVSIIFRLNKDTTDKFKHPTAAFRIPANKFCLELLSKLDKPLISTSVNKSGSKPLNDPDLIFNQFGEQVDAVFYSKDKPGNSASTLIDLTENIPKLIREGSIKFESILQKFYA